MRVELHTVEEVRELAYAVEDVLLKKSISR